MHAVNAGSIVHHIPIAVLKLSARRKVLIGRLCAIGARVLDDCSSPHCLIEQSIEAVGHHVRGGEVSLFLFHAREQEATDCC